MSKKAAALAKEVNGNVIEAEPVEVNGNVLETEPVDVNGNVSEDTTFRMAMDHRTENSNFQKQNRIVNVFMELDILPDGVTKRVGETLDRHLTPFSEYPEFVATLNNERVKRFGDDGAFYRVRFQDKFIKSYPEKLIYRYKIHSITGVLHGCDVFTPEEATEELAKCRGKYGQRNKTYEQPKGKNETEYLAMKDALEKAQAAQPKKKTAVAN